MQLALAEIAERIHGALEGGAGGRATGYSIDTRTLRPGELFFAIRGPRFDGHAFVEAAARQGAAAVVVSAPVAGADGLPRIRVDSTTAALQELARSVRRQWGRTVIAVTGSAGKTTTKEMIAAVLDRRGRVLRSAGNLNNEFGVPLSLLGLEPEHDVAVLEMGMSAAGEIRRLAAIAEPNEGVVTNVGAAHLEFFESVDAIAQAKAELLEGLVGARRAYLNYDDPRVRAMARRFDGAVVTYALKTAAGFRGGRLRSRGLEGSTFAVRHRRRLVDFTLPLAGAHNVSNALAAISVGVTHGVPWEDVQAAVAGLVPPARRGRAVRYAEGFVLIDDCYNSNPRALHEMIRLLAGTPGFARRILVAGEMRELGPESRRLHADCGRRAAEARLDWIVGVAGDAAALVDGARAAGADPGRLHFAADAAEAGRWLADTIRAGDLVLVKGSRGVGLERAIDGLNARRAPVEP